MNIVIPMAGRGKRFKDKMYTKPKPLIDIAGKTMIRRAIESLGLIGKYNFVIQDDEYAEEIEAELKGLHNDAYILRVGGVTDGPACTCLLLEDQINNDEELVIANCDQIMLWNAEYFLHATQYGGHDGVIVTYTETTEKNSYAVLDNSGFVRVIKEKEVLSSISLNGIHYWRKGRWFVESAKNMIKNNDKAVNGEYYVGPTYNYMIEFGHKIGIHHIPDEQHNPVGTPDDLERFLAKL